MRVDKRLKMWYTEYMSRKRALRVGIVFGDVHDPYCDEEVWGMFVKAVKLIKPDFLVENGDGFDFYQVSPFSKDPGRLSRLSDDREVFVRRRKALRKVAGDKCECTYLPGNHELWLRKYIWRHAVELSSLPELEWYEFLKLEEADWGYVNFDGIQLPSLQLGQLAVTHGHISRKPLGASMRAMLDEVGQSVLFNHTHRMGWLPSSNRAGDIEAFENGCLCQKTLAHEYIKGAIRWQQGFSVITQYPDGDFRIHPVMVKRVPGKRVRRMMLHEGVLECKM